MKYLKLYIPFLVVFNILSFDVQGQYNYLPNSHGSGAYSQSISDKNNFYNGTKSIGIPLLGIQDEGISIQISANYTTSGIEVTKESSWLGLGWELSYGGKISKVVMDKDDSKFIDKSGKIRDGYLNRTALGLAPIGYLPPNNEINNSLEVIPDQNLVVAAWSNIDPEVPYLGDDGNEYILFDDFCERDTVDLMSDIYTFSFPNGSGKFIINRNGDFVPLSNHNYQINYLGIDNGWLIIDDKGIKYYYGINNNSRKNKYSKSYSFFAQDEHDPLEIPLDGLGPNEISSIDSWQISKIETPQGGQIIYSYDKSIKAIHSIPNYSENLTKVYGNLLDVTGNTNVTVSNGRTANVTRLSYDDVLISSISNTKGCQIKFHIGGNRDDLIGGKKLDFIEKVINQSVIRTIDFDNQSYFVSNPVDIANLWQNRISNYSSNPDIFSDRIGVNNLKRLKLSKIYIKGQNEMALPPYVFTYNETTLPPKTSMSTDFWGYSNLNTSNETFNTSPFPNGTYMYFDNIESCYSVNFNEGNKLPNFEYARASILESITSPLGSKSIFEYELNQFEDTPLENVYDQPSEIYDGFKKYLSGNDLSMDPLFLDADFNFFHDESCHNLIEIDLKGFVGNQSLCPDLSYILKLTHNISGEIFEVPINAQLNSDNSFQVQFTNNLSVPSGSYSVDLYQNGCILGINDSSFLDISIRSKYISGEILLTEGAGLRIKRSSFFDGIGNEKIDYFEYSNGKLFGVPSFLSGELYLEEFSLENPGRFINIHSNSLVPLTSSFINSPVGYGNVRITTSDLINNKSFTKEFDFFNKKSIVENNYQLLKLGINRFNSSKNGSLLNEFSYNNSGQKVQETNYSYDLDYNKFDWIWSTFILEDNSNLRAIQQTNLPFHQFEQTDCPALPHPMILVTYATIPQWNKLVKKTVRTWGSDGSGPLNEYHDYIHDDQTYLLKQSKISDDNSLSKETKFKYPVDLNIDFMIDRNMKNIPLEVIVNDGDGGGEKTDMLVVGDFVVPKKYYTALEGGGWKEVTDLTYDNSDDYYPDKIKNNTKPQAEILVWGAGDNVGLLESRKYAQREWNYEYSNIRILEKSTDNNGIFRNFSFDGLQQLHIGETNNNSIISTNTYEYNLANNGKNKISTTIEHNAGGYTTENLYDGLGRKVETKKISFLDGGGDLTIRHHYDALGNLIQESDPTKGGPTTFIHEQSPLRRLLTTYPEGSSIPVNVTHRIEGTKFVTQIEDENNVITKTYSDIFGRTTKSVDGMGQETKYTYNDKDQVIKIDPPGPGQDYLFKYLPDGKLELKSIPNKGTYSYQYDAYDNLQTEILPNEREVSYEYHTIYNDFLLNKKVDGTVILEITPSDLSLVKDWIGKQEEAIHSFEGIYPNAHVITYSNFDPKFGRPLSISTSTIDGSYTENLTYDDLGNILVNDRIISGPDGTYNVEHTSTYQIGERLKSSKTNVNGLQIGVEEFKYNGSDWLTNKKLIKGIQSIGYGYNIRGWLTSINGVGDGENEELPCEELPYTPPNVQCDKLVSIVQSFMIEYDCFKIQNGDPTVIKINGLTTTFNDNGFATNTTSNETVLLLNGGNLEQNGNDLNNNTGFDIEGSNDPLNIAYIESLIDCINNNPQLLEDILNAINGILLPPDNEEENDVDEQEEDSEYRTKASMFGMRIYYDQGNAELSARPQYNGNISWIEWKNTPLEQRYAYGFNYDKNDRLTSAIYGEALPPEQECEIDRKDKYSVLINEYDALGNINSITRMGLLNPSAEVSNYGIIDNLIYTYENTNQLSSVEDNASSLFGFNGNISNYSYLYGNLISDSQKDIQKIDYSFNDLPLEIETSNGKIFNWYTTSGQKVKSEFKSPEYDITRNYIAEVEFFNGEVESIYSAEGRIVFEDNEPYVEYYLKDHLGNTRVRIADKDGDNAVLVNPKYPEKDEIMSSHHYYPFGMEWDKPQKNGYGNPQSSSGIEERYTFNGNEKIQELGLNLMDFNARWYNPALGRFISVDPLTDHINQVNKSPFAFAWNNPIGLIDPDGMCPDCTDPPTNETYHYLFDLDISITASKSDGTHKDQTPERYGYRGSFEDYQKQYGFEGVSYENVSNYWEAVHRADFDHHVAYKDQQEQDRIALERMRIFVFLMSTSGTMGLGALTPSLPSPKSFTFTSPIASSGEWKILNSLNEVQGVPGLYQFPHAARGFKPYIGQSNNLGVRLSTHFREGNIGGTIRFRAMNNSTKLLREIGETQRMFQIGGRTNTLNNLANMRMPLSQTRATSIGVKLY